jgi:uncharacterized protein YcbX
MRIERLYRYPVKGLTPEALERITVETGHAIPWDRAFALAQGDAPLDLEAPTWLPKRNFMCQMANASIAGLRASFNDRSGTLSVIGPHGAIEANVLTAEGRARVAAWLTAFLGPAARGTPHFLHRPGHVFSDSKAPVISLINMASLAALEARAGARRHKRRFRANIWYSGAPAWSERDWPGRELLVGQLRVRVLRGIPRCAATEVNPETCERDADPVAELKALNGDINLGVYAEVIEGGAIAMGDGIALLPA